MNKKLILLDYDDTTTRKDGTVSERTVDSIKKNQKAGNIIGFSTSRPRYQVVEFQKKNQTSEFVISSNGSEIYDNKKKIVIYESLLSKEIVKQLIDLADTYDVRLILSVKDFDYVTKEIKNPHQKIINKEDITQVKQGMFISEEKDKIRNIKKIIQKDKRINIIDERIGSINWITIVNQNTSKGNALKELANYLEIPKEDTIAIGNDKNDISMFQEAGLSVAVGNAKESIKKQVDVVTKSNEEDGVAIFLESLLEK